MELVDVLEDATHSAYIQYILFQIYTHYISTYVVWILGVALGCRASPIIYQNTQVYGDCQLIIAINASIRQLTVQPNATSSGYPSDCYDYQSTCGAKQSLRKSKIQEGVSFASTTTCSYTHIYG